MQPTCIKCGGMRFELSESELKISSAKLAFVQCTNCGGVIGVVEITKRTPSAIPELNKTIKPMEDTYQVEL
jgi:hypothetical protein